MTEAGQGQVPVGQLLGQQPKRPSKWRAAARWRDWRLSVKLAAVTLVPIVIALVLGGITISNQVSRNNDYERIDRLVVLSNDVRGLTDALQQERTQTANLLTQGTVGSSPELDAARAASDKALRPISSDTQRVTQLDNAIDAPGTAANNALARLGEVRQQVAAGQLDSVQALDAYSAMTTALLTLDTSLVAGMGDASISGTANALHDLQVAKEEVSTSQVLVGYGIVRGNLTPTQLNQLRTAEVRLADRLEDFRAAATGGQGQDFDRTVTGPDFDTRSRLVSSVLAAQGVTAGDALDGISAEQWGTVSNNVVNSLRQVSGRLGDQVSATSTDLVETSGTDAGLLAVLLFAALVITAAVVFLITRQLLRSLRLLRTSALDVADRQLPAAVQNIQEGREQSAEVSPVLVGTEDEVGEVAKAFDAVHSQALRLAIEQAAMRTGYSSVFINLSRRSQSLVQRQLQLIERLERDEEDADQLATLFQLDHLATRMRRNNENLMVLSGAEPGRRSGQPVSTADVLRAAVSEIEQYQRVQVQTPPTARIVGYGASDLMRLVAELLDNATAFSAPETQVTVSTRVSDGGGLLIDIMDKGIGMNEAEVAEANARLTEAATVDLATSRRMGLFVVGRLAGRHHIGVTLHGGKDIVGVRATVTVPAELVMDLPEAVVPAQAPAETTQQTGALPRRRAVNGAGRAGALTSLAGTTSGTLGDGAATPGPWNQNGHSGVLPPRPPSDVEVSGTALFNPIQPEDAGEPPAEPDAVPDDELPSGAALFAANTSAGALTEWWSAAAAEPKPEPPPTRETTPIFDETLSAWFRSEEPAPKPKTATDEEPEAGPEAGPESVSEEKASTGWDFAADERFRTVQAVSQSEPSSYTDAGLPRRRRGEQLMPGSATPEAAQPAKADAAPPLPVRDPADVRGRLSSFQQGLNRARHAAGDQPAEATAAPAETQQPQQESPAEGAQVLPQRRPSSGLPQRQAWPQQEQTEAAESTPSPVPRRENPLPQRRPLAEQQPPETALPQRRPAAEPAETQQPQPVSAADAAETQLPQRRPAAEQAETALPQRQPEAPEQPGASAPLPRRRPRSEPAAAEATGAFRWQQSEDSPGGEELFSGGTQPQEATQYSRPASVEESAWSFETDESWRTVQAVSQSTPSGYTAAGLPRRRRGEQLMPGSASTVGASGPRTQRDPQDVRGRLSSFQAGVRRGRHRTGQPVDSEHETMEGE
ncbi:nitrate- and nitrite sensing domain-containing protein [Amycolatopsis sp.]|uniref:sensor histidine kinase n=1 Tax=Amycolatopsis sp. TaxID=37632 RepID=UPI002B74986A|nr:nitrate- and nitrite sensing domain-containing protein [Amycolatopsis sp.]HVV10162.1 nitrate- and nitrite sensing domain-containing protein [Amycolatopsis sp.]